MASRIEITDRESLSSPLLHDSTRNDEQTPERNKAVLRRATKPLSKLVLYFMALHFLLGFCDIILNAPLIWLFENSLCLKYYEFPDGGVEESLCKIPEIQRPLATIRGWKSMLDMFPVFLVAIPLGKLGDHCGHRKVMAWALLGVIASLCEIFLVCAFPRVFPLQLVWLSSVILLCGGGLNSASAFMWAMASASIPSERRSHVFYYIFSAFYLAELISSYVASITTDISPWIPCCLSMGSAITCLVLLCWMPDPHKSHGQVTAESEAIEVDFVAKLTSSYPSVDGYVSAFKNRNICLTIPVFLVGIYRYATLNMLIQYSSVRFHTRISAGAKFYTETAAINIVLFSFLVPRTTAHVRSKYNVRPQKIDLFLVRTSVIFMCIGCFAIGLAQSSATLPIGVFVFAAGFGSRVSALSLVSYWISDDAKATFYSTIVVIESLGHAICDPAMQQIYAASLGLSPFWSAMPFFLAGTLYFAATLSASFIRLE